MLLNYFSLQDHLSATQYDPQYCPTDHKATTNATGERSPTVPQRRTPLRSLPTPLWRPPRGAKSANPTRGPARSSARFFLCPFRRSPLNRTCRPASRELRERRRSARRWFSLFSHRSPPPGRPSPRAPHRHYVRSTAAAPTAGPEHAMALCPPTLPPPGQVLPALPAVVPENYFCPVLPSTAAGLGDKSIPAADCPFRAHASPDGCGDALPPQTGTATRPGPSPVPTFFRVGTRSRHSQPAPGHGAPARGSAARRRLLRPPGHRLPETRRRAGAAALAGSHSPGSHSTVPLAGPEPGPVPRRPRRTYLPSLERGAAAAFPASPQPTCGAGPRMRGAARRPQRGGGGRCALARRRPLAVGRGWPPWGERRARGPQPVSWARGFNSATLLLLRAGELWVLCCRQKHEEVNNSVFNGVR